MQYQRDPVIDDLDGMRRPNIRRADRGRGHTSSLPIRSHRSDRGHRGHREPRKRGRGSHIRSGRGSRKSSRKKRHRDSSRLSPIISTIGTAQDMSDYNTDDDGSSTDSSDYRRKNKDDEIDLESGSPINKEVIFGIIFFIIMIAVGFGIAPLFYDNFRDFDTTRERRQMWKDYYFYPYKNYSFSKIYDDDGYTKNPGIANIECKRYNSNNEFNFPVILSSAPTREEIQIENPDSATQPPLHRYPPFNLHEEGGKSINSEYNKHFNVKELDNWKYIR